MRLLIVTQVVDKNDPVLGFFHTWITEFASRCESVEVICLLEGTHTLSKNVRVHSLGKEKGRQGRMSYARSFISLVWRLRKEYDAVFVHMNAEYVVLAGLTWKLLKKRIVLWYTHGTVSMRLRAATILSDVVCTASSRSMRLATPKKRVLGHGMNMAMFPLVSAPIGALQLMTAGRIAPVKRIEFFIDALAQLKQKGVEATLVVVGAPATEEDTVYEKKLHAQIESLGLKDMVTFRGGNQTDVRDELARSHVFLHASNTGSLDKAPLEALACGVSVVTVNEEIGGVVPGAYLSEPSSEVFGAVLEKMIAERPWENASLREAAHTYVEKTHSLPGLIGRILVELAPARHAVRT